MADDDLPAAPQQQPDRGTTKRKLPRNATKDALQLCEEREILRKMADVADTLFSMLSFRYRTAMNNLATITEQNRASFEAFAKDKSAVQLADATQAAFERVAQYAYPKVQRVDANVTGRVQFDLTRLSDAELDQYEQLLAKASDARADQGGEGATRH